MRYKQVKNLSPVDAGYIAGFIDGEGTLTLTHKNRGGNRQFVITISSTEYDLVKNIQNLVGAGGIVNKTAYKENHSLSYTFRISNQQAITLLRQIFSYLKGYKRKRAALILKRYNKLTPRNGKYSKSLLAERGKFIQSFFAIKS